MSIIFRIWWYSTKNHPRQNKTPIHHPNPDILLLSVGQVSVCAMYCMCFSVINIVETENRGTGIYLEDENVDVCQSGWQYNEV